MSKIIIFLTLIIGLITTAASAQYNTGDVQLNASLTKIDADAKLDFGTFKADLKARYNVAEAKIESWSADIGMKAGDIYLACETAKITKKPVDEVVTVYQKNKDKGWGVIAKELGIKPGSPEFHALKNGTGEKASKGHGHGPKEKGKEHEHGKGKH